MTTHNDDRQATSLVSRCDATICRYNEDTQCVAGQIEVSMSGQMAQCLTFTPQDDASDSQRPGQSTHS
ncbi:DUF1540 domain-containing protein [Deinococcus navajonensis]|uniref:DUF1540 domain-containing protein n=1 Tax=Deinococcus navajonensis TaxID=309884 RepID=A0ABV8XLB0_9DEIO